MNQEIIISVFTIVMILIIYYAVFSAKKNAEKDIKKMQENLKVGDKIITYSGFAGVIKKVEGDRLIVAIYPNEVEMSIEKWAIAGIDDRTLTTKDEDTTKDKEKEKNEDKTESKRD